MIYLLRRGIFAMRWYLVSAVAVLLGGVVYSAQNNVKFVFAHGLGGDEKQARFYYRDSQVISDANVEAFRFPCAYKKEEHDKTNCSLAQKREIDALSSVCNSISQDKVLVGVSMGATTILNYVGTKKTENIRALIVECPFDHIARVVRNQSIFTRLMPEWICFKIIQLSVARQFTGDGPHARDSVKNIPKNIPVILIHSKEDKLIPISSSRNIYTLLVESGHKDVYLLELPEGAHADCISSNVSRHLYETGVHAFYKKYNLPHDKHLAARGVPVLAQCQPTIEEVKNRK